MPFRRRVKRWWRRRALRALRGGGEMLHPGDTAGEPEWGKGGTVA